MKGDLFAESSKAGDVCVFECVLGGGGGRKRERERETEREIKALRQNRKIGRQIKAVFI